MRTPRALSLGFLKRESERSCALYLRDFAVFPTFPIRFGGSGAPLSREAVPPSPGPLTIDAERYLEMLAPLPIEGSVHVKSRVIGVHPRGTGNGFVETDSIVTDDSEDPLTCPLTQRLFHDPVILVASGEAPCINHGKSSHSSEFCT